MVTDVRAVFVTTDGDVTKEVTIRTEDGRLMKNRLKNLMREHPRITVDKKLGKELLEQADELRVRYLIMQEINRTTLSELNSVRKKFEQNEAFYVALIGPLPVSYLEGHALQ